MTTEIEIRNWYRISADTKFGHLVVVAMGLVLAGCAQHPTQFARSSVAASVPTHDAIVLPAPGGLSVVDVVERRYANAVEQHVALATNASVSGQNFIRVQIFGPVGAESTDSALAIPAMSESSLAREMRESVPGVMMSRSPLFVQNDYGPFGYAVGRSGQGDLCLYGWQRISGGASGAPFSNVGIIHLRMRICEAGASEHALLATMYGFTINTSFAAPSWNPFGSPPGPDGRLGSTGQPIYPVSSIGLATVLDEEPAPAPPPIVRQAPVVVHRAPARATIPDNAPIVPLPPDLIHPEPVPLVPAPPTE